MEQLKRVFLLLALVTWLVPQPIKAQEKVTFRIYDSPDKDWVMGRDVATANKLYQQWLLERDSTRNLQKPRKLLTKPVGYNVCSCVSYARWRSGINVGPIGVARNHPVNSQTPSIGDIAVTYESRAGHLSYIVDIDANYIYVDEANYSSCRVTYHRAIPINSPLIKGFYK